jgi:uncharacterized protein YjbI with pentapeptide repeats
MPSASVSLRSRKHRYLGCTTEAMASPEHVNLLLKSILEWNAWRVENPKIRPDLSGADLSSGAAIGRNGKPSYHGFRGSYDWHGPAIHDLAGANLKNADLRGADLRTLDLTRTSFVEADLRAVRFGSNYFARCLFNRANLSDVDLSGQDLSKINMSGTNLRGADLSRTHIERAHFGNADCRGASFRGAYIIVVNTADGAKFHGADFTDAKFPDVGTSEFHVHSFDENSLLNLSFADGLDAVSAGSDRIVEYLSLAFEYAHEPEGVERQLRPEYVAEALQRIRALRLLYADVDLPPRSLSIAIQSISEELIRYLAQHPSAMHQLRPRQFEELIAEILSSHGWHIHLTPTTRDGGADILAVAQTSAGLSTPWLVECKKYAPENKVDVSVVRSLYGLKCEQQHGGALLATTSQFTKDALQYKSSRYNLHLRDFSGIVEWINAYRPSPIGKLHITNNRLVLSGGLNLPRL